MLRKRKNRRYNETNDEDGERKFDLAEQIKSKRFDQIREKHLQELPGEAITLRLIQKNGFEKPILVSKPNGLDLRVPPKSFLVRDVRNCVGHQRIIDVMDVKTQKNIEMSMKDWCKYYESKNRDRLLNVISLEFSHTKLDELVESPMIVKLLDWVDLVWPKFLKQSQIDSTNTIDKMKYPKVQKYCLMSVKGSYTDFHIDFGGTSVWYHILRGKKIFWMVPPTELNLQIFEEWTLSGMQQDVFFGDTVEECFRVELTAGNTFFIPSGWIHAVYTLEDSLVFGGNFLHSFGMENQLKVSRIEDATKVPVKFRYPFYTEILWYVVQHYVYCLMEKDHLHRPDVVAAAAQAATEKAVAIKNSGNSIEIEDEDDETTESEHDERDTNNKKKKKTAPKSTKRKLGRQTKNSSRKSAKKAPPKPPTDDESTDIDSANEESDSKKPNLKPTVNTCRMTKNSLLRLQYEVDEQQFSNSNNSKLSDKGSEIKSPSTKKKNEASVLSTQNQSLTSSNSSANTINLADLVLSHENSKSNGWSDRAGQSTWCNPNSNSTEPKKIHITKFEVNGLKVLVKHLSKLSGVKKNLPTLIRNSRALLDDCRKLIVEHENDDPELAVTGKPITPELLNISKGTDMNELIGQFFKPTESIGGDEVKNQSINSSTISTISKAKSETATQQRLKPNNPDAVKDSVITTTNNDKAATTTMTAKSPNKETKCLSPNKKLSSLASSSFSSASAASTASERPKSPPTRPLSNNQYTSKTKHNNNLLLPGSFADLIAATSTDNKTVFDISAQALHGISSKDLVTTPTSINKSTSKHSPTTVIKGQNSTHASVSSSKATNDFTIPTHTATTVAGSGVKKAESSLKPNSPEPPKTGTQKRFITPASVRAQGNKEKLIYASAPYISPVHISDQSRSMNSYRWQTPISHAQHPAPQQTYSPATPRPQTHASSPTAPTVPATYAPEPRSSQPDHAPRSDPNRHHPQHLSMAHQRPDSRQQGNTDGSVNHHQTESNNLPKHQSSQSLRANVIQRDHHEPKQKVEDVSSKELSKHDSNKKTVEAVDINIKPVVSKSTVNTKAEPSESVIKTSSQEAEAKIKKPTKPRGPPKKSKEAREAIETINCNLKQTIPTSVIRVAPSMDPVPAGSSSGNASAPVKVIKPKKRPKKQKDSNLPAASMASHPSSAIFTTAGQAKQAGQPSVICGLVAPPNGAAVSTAAKMNPQSYIISRPLLFNTMPTFSAAHFQQMPRTNMPLITTAPMSSHIGLPLQQGARIVWATPPRRLASPQVSEASALALQPLAGPAVAGASKTVAQTRPPITTHSDNAALLSLATTALSTASMVSSPALSQLSNRAPQSRAIMVSSANQPALFNGPSPYFQPYMQRMPMQHFITGPGAPRPSGQLVFARLPNQAQPRYLITQPGFMAQQRFPGAAHIVTSQPTSTLAFATFKPTSTSDSTKAMKTKKVKTS